MWTDALAWAGIVVCVIQSAMFSGLNLAFFSLSRLRLEVEVSSGNRRARAVRDMRQDANFLLTTILWGNVAVNVLLTLLSDSVLAGIGAFFFSTVVITFAGEILPQAYFSRRALRMAAGLAPVLRFYQLLLFPVAKPSALMLDLLLGPEGIRYFRENEMRNLLRAHIDADEADIDRLEGIGALNFLALDDLMVADEGEIVDPNSVIELPIEEDVPVFPEIEHDPNGDFLKRIHRSGRKWVIVTDDTGSPRFVINSDEFLRSALFDPSTFNPVSFCHRPIVVTNLDRKLGSVISQWKVTPSRPGDNVIDQDIILVWNVQKRVITGSDILGRLLGGIASISPQPAHAPAPA